MAVVVQEMVLAESAGVLFTANPVSGARNEILINAAWGLGEAVVSGLVTPDTLVIDKTTGQLKSELIADKRVMTVRTPEGVEERAVPDALRKQPTLDSEQIAQLVALANAVERHAGRPMDLEWAIAEGRLYLLQARPITALPPELEEPDLMGMEWSRLMLIERYPDPVTPFTWFAVKEMLLAAFDASSKMSGGRESSPDVPMVRLFYGRPYMNMTKFKRGLAASPLEQPTELQTAETSSSEAALEGSAAKKPFSSRFSLKMLPLLPKLINLLRTTHREWDRLLPPYETLMRQEAGQNWEGFTMAELLEKISRYDSLRDPLMTNHAYSIIAAEISRQLLTSITRAWLGDEDEQLATTLLSGLTGNVTVETNRALWRIAVSVRGHSQLRQALKAPLHDDWREQFAALPAGSAFLSDLHAFLGSYGHRSPSYDFMLPTWREQPEPILNMVQMYLDDSVIDPGEGEARQARERETAVRMARQKLSLLKRPIFDRVLSLAQTYFRLRENQQFYIQLSLPMGRQMLLVLEDRLREKGLLHEAGDVFFLEKHEIDALAMQLAGLPLEDRTVPANPAQLATERRAALARYQKISAPVHLGGDRVASKIALSDGTLRGVAASRGKATGKARLVHGPADFSKLQPGEIIVAPATTPTWTPLFGVAAGLVTDYGGLLSHAGVVAREYGLPAVLGTDNATQMIQNGDQITVDGNRGLVLIH
jgi:pyruvate,water dikinase